MKVTVDLNVLLDVAQNRLPHYHASEEVLHRARLGEFAAVLPGHALTTLHFILEKYAGTPLANETVDGLLADFAVHPVDKVNFQRARQLPLKDFEDAVVAVVAERPAAITSSPGTCRTLQGQLFRPSPRLSFWKRSPPSKLVRPGGIRAQARRLGLEHA